MKLPNKVIVKQEIETIEIFTNFETKNKYSINTEDGKQLYYAYEDGSNFFIRQILGSHRPITLNVIDSAKSTMFTLTRAFFFFLPDHDVKSNNVTAGSIKGKWTWFNRTFEINAPSGKLLCRAKFPHIWTFDIFRGSQKVGQILKKWSGVGKEMFTDADTFMVDFGVINDDPTKKMILATAFAIDLRYFEMKKS